MINANTLRKLASLNLDAEQMSGVIDLLADIEARDELRKEAQRERVRRHRERRFSNVTETENDNYTPVPPFSDKEKSPTPPKEINSSPLTPQTTLQGASAEIDFESLSQKLEAAGNGKIQPHSLIVVGPVVELLASGASLDLDVLPTVRKISARLSRMVTLSYFLGPIREAYELRVNAGRCLTPAKPLDESEIAWARRLKYARINRCWSTPDHGPMPGLPGCRVPEGIIIDGDGEGWSEWVPGQKIAAG